MYRNSCMCIKSDAWSATTTWKHKFRKNTILVASHTTECLCSIRNSYDKIVEVHSHAPSHKIRSFYWKLTKTPIGRTVDGNADHHISKPIITMMSCIRIVTEAIQKINTRDQRKIKIAILAITTYTSILIRSYKHYKVCSVLQERL